MAVKIFVLGCSGSGKSTAARYIAMLAKDKGWLTTSIDDYEILYRMFWADTEGKQFRPAPYGGFDVLDPSVYGIALSSAYHIALQEVEQVDWYPDLETKKLLLIQFARNDYREVLKLFGEGFLQDAYFLYLDANPDICIQRIYKRAMRPTTLDDHFVPEYIVETYLHEENRQHMESGLQADYGIDEQDIQRVKIIDNRGSLQDFAENIRQFVHLTLDREADMTPSVGVSREFAEVD